MKPTASDPNASEPIRRPKKKAASPGDDADTSAPKRRPLSDFAGLWKDAPKEDLEKFEAWRRESRALDIEKMDRLIKRIREP
jgi:hypothetical protein